MNLFDFNTMFPGDKECIEFFITIRECAGMICPICGCVKHSWLSSEGILECGHCGIQLDMKFGTIMENTKLPIRFWLIAICLLTSSETELSVYKLKEKLGHVENDEVEEMLNNLNTIKNKTERKYTFNSLLYNCVKFQN